MCSYLYNVCHLILALTYTSVYTRRDVETIKGCVRDLSMKLLDLANTGTVPVGMSMSGVSSSMNLSSGAGGVSGMNNSNTGMCILCGVMYIVFELLSCGCESVRGGEWQLVQNHKELNT